MFGWLKNTFDFLRYDFPRGLKNLIVWFPVIWRDRSWDHYYIYAILHKKLLLQEKAIRNGIALYSDKTADDIKLCVLLLARLKKDEYHTHAFKQYYDRWGELKMNLRGQCLNIYSEKVNTEKGKELERKDFRRAGNKEHQLRMQDVDLLFKTMNKHIEKWWD
jgi:hypothetical protein